MKATAVPLAQRLDIFVYCFIYIISVYGNKAAVIN